LPLYHRSALRKVGSILGKGVQKLTTWAYRKEHDMLHRTPVQLFPAGALPAGCPRLR
jgi:hypothetical protein